MDSTSAGFPVGVNLLFSRSNPTTGVTASMCCINIMRLKSSKTSRHIYRGIKVTHTDVQLKGYKLVKKRFLKNSVQGELGIRFPCARITQWR
jgi:hypothetical protein